MSAVFYQDDAQREAIDATRHKFVKMPDQVQTEIAALEKFWIAEDYHQKYRLRHENAIVGELQAIYPNEPDFINSTAAARLNGYLDGYGSSKQLDLEIEKLGLSPDGQALLRKQVR
ncbi:MAG: peptide-methionine (S)-S-oxide reductase [Planctomycetota bacterium]|jgi:peptide-methionine (S)-S-oxide reductase